MKTWKTASLVAVLAVSSTRYSFACMWDRDTLVDEQRGLPEITAIIVGRYERHTPEFYERRIRTASAELPGVSGEKAKLLLDDIAVAQDRLKNYDAAIAIARQKIARFGVDYRVASNLGTFYLHKKDLTQAETWINRALKINPNAHFGREWVQLQAIKYFQSEGKKPFWNAEIEGRTSGRGNRDNSYRKTMVEAGLNPNALEGIEGLIKIGDHDTPEYFAALGQLLLLHDDYDLSSMAFWRAVEVAKANHPKREDWLLRAKKAFRGVSASSMTLSSIFGSKKTDSKLPFAETSWFVPKNKAQADLKRAFVSQRDYAEKWRAAFQKREREVIRSGGNPEDIALFANFYQEWGKPQEFWNGQDNLNLFSW